MNNAAYRKRAIRNLIIFFVTLLLFTSFTYQSTRRVSLSMESRKLYKGKSVTVKADIYYTYSDGNMVIHYTYPEEYVFISNIKGEVKVYYPNSNQVEILQNDIFSTRNDVLHYFLMNKTNDMGLGELGCRLQNTSFENDLIISTWTPPLHLSEHLNKIELVHQDYQPIYTAYHHINGNVTKKMYYADYYEHRHGSIPQRITEIEYVSPNDSVINRKIYSNLKFDSAAMGGYFNFKIPEDAKLKSGSQ